MISDVEPSASDVDIDCTLSDLLESMEDNESLSNLAAPLPTLLTPIQTPVHDQCSEESVFRLHPSPNPMLEEPLHASRDTDRASTKTRVRIDPHRMPTGDRKVVTVGMSTTPRTAPRHPVSDIPAGITPDGMLIADLSFRLISLMTNDAGFSRCRHPGVTS